MSFSSPFGFTPSIGLFYPTSPREAFGSRFKATVAHGRLAEHAPMSREKLEQKLAEWLSTSR